MDRECTAAIQGGTVIILGETYNNIIGRTSTDNPLPFCLYFRDYHRRRRG